METKELLKKVRKIEIKTKGLSAQIFSGEYHSAFKGKGMAFSEVREYAIGDEIRTIDWNVTARLDEPYVKVFEEERELVVMLLIDISGSEAFGTNKQLKKELIAEISAVLAFSAIQNNDKIGAILFTENIEKFIPPKKGKKHILRIIRELLEFEPAGSKTDVSGALKYFNNSIKKRSIGFVISDFRDENYYDTLKIANKRHDIVALRVFDKFEAELPNIGLAPFLDAEQGTTKWVNTSSKKVRKEYKKRALEFKGEFAKTMRKCGVDFAEVSTGSPYIIPLVNLFKKR